MALFPLFIDLKGKKCVIVGGSTVAERRAQALLKFDARITIVSPEVSEKIRKLAEDEKLSIIRELYNGEYLEDAFLAVAATSDRDANENVYQDAIKKGIHVNIADCPENSTFTFPSVVMRNELVIGITTSGEYPGFSKEIRQRIEKVVPESVGEALELLGASRRRVFNEFTSTKTRKELLEKLSKEVLGGITSLGKIEMKLIIESVFEEYKDEKKN